MKKCVILLLSLCYVLLYKPCDAQLLKKIKDKVSQATNKVLNTSDSTQASQTNGDGAASENGKPTNKGGAGLKNTLPPDVNQQIADAEQAYQGNKYSDARYSIQRALMSIELQLGRELLR